MVDAVTVDELQQEVLVSLVEFLDCDETVAYDGDELEAKRVRCSVVAAAAPLLLLSNLQ